MITTIKLFRESLNRINERVDNKDWERMLKLVLANDDGEKMANSITDKNKAIARFVAGLKLKGEQLKYSDGFYYGSFGSFRDKALRLGATPEEIQTVYDATEVPEAYSTKKTDLSSKKLGSSSVGAVSRALIDLGYDIKFLPHNSNAITHLGRDAMSRNGRNWTIGYKTEIDLGSKTVNLNFDVITDEGDSRPNRYIIDSSSDIIFRNINNWKEYGVREFITLIIDCIKRGLNTNENIKINENDGDTRFNYMMLSRLQSDCEYFLNWGKGRSQLHSGTVEQHIAKMKELWNILEEKPEWLSMEEILQYENDMLAKREEVNNEL